MSNCDEVKLLLGAYADGQLESIETDAVTTHLEQCGRCRQTVREQQRVQHVFDAYQPPLVAEPRWAEMSKRLRAELEGHGQRTVLKTRSRVEALEPTPPAQPSLRSDETRPSASRPTPRPRPVVTPGRGGPAVTVLKVHVRRPHARFGWVAHLVGAVAAVLLVALCLHSLWIQPETTVVSIALARPQDVAIMNIETMDPDYNVIVYAGDASDVAAVWVVPSQSEG